MLRSERYWWWLPAFCWGSLVVHSVGFLIWRDARLFAAAPQKKKPQEIIVTLEPIKNRKQFANLTNPRNTPLLDVQEVPPVETPKPKPSVEEVEPIPEPEPPTPPKTRPDEEQRIVRVTPPRIVPVVPPRVRPTPPPPVTSEETPEPDKLEPVPVPKPQPTETPQPPTFRPDDRTPPMNAPRIVQNRTNVAQPVAPTNPVANPVTPDRRVPTADENPTDTTPDSVAVNTPLPRDTSLAARPNSPDLLTTPSESANPTVNDRNAQRSSTTFALRARTGPTPVVAPMMTPRPSTRGTANTLPDTPSANPLNDVLNANRPVVASAVPRNATINRANPNLASSETNEATPNALARLNNTNVSVPNQIRNAASRITNPTVVATTQRTIQRTRPTIDPDQPNTNSGAFASNVAPRNVPVPRTGGNYSRTGVRSLGEDTPDERPAASIAKSGARNPEQTMALRSVTPTRGAVQTQAPKWFTPRSGGAGKGAELPGTGGQGEMKVAAVAAPRVGGGRAAVGSNPLFVAATPDSNPQARNGIQVGSGTTPTLGGLQREQGRVAAAGARKAQQSRAVGGNTNPSDVPDVKDSGAFGITAKNTTIPRAGGRRGEGANPLLGLNAPDELPNQGFTRAAAPVDAVALKRGQTPQQQVASSKARTTSNARPVRTDTDAPTVAASTLATNARNAPTTVRQGGALKPNTTNALPTTDDSTSPAANRGNTTAATAANLSGARSNAPRVAMADKTQRGNTARVRSNGGELPDAGNLGTKGADRVADNATVRTGGGAVKPSTSVNPLAGGDPTEGANPNARATNSPTANAANLGNLAENKNQKVAQGGNNRPKPTTTARKKPTNDDEAGPQIKGANDLTGAPSLAERATVRTGVGAAQSNQSLLQLLTPDNGSRNTVFVLDVSKSMSEGDRIGQAKVTLKDALRQMGTGRFFNIVTFHGAVSSYKRAMIEVTPASIEAACKYVDDIKLGPYTNVSDALLEALKNKEAELIFLLSDGEPNGGGIVDHDQLRAAVRQANAKKIKINTIALGLAGQFEAVALLQGIAQDNNGEFNKVDLSKTGGD